MLFSPKERGQGLVGYILLTTMAAAIIATIIIIHVPD